MSTDQASFVVGIGASAGGLHALEGLFRGLPADTGMAFVVVTHLPRGRKSVLASILGRSTKMPVVVSAKGAVVQPNHVYVAQPDNPLIIKAGRLGYGEERPEFARHPIDQFFLSLAENSREAAVGILLSGGGFDGTLGMRAIHEQGGLTIAQGHNGSAPQQSSMPDAAIAAGVVDLVLTTEEVGPRLAELARASTVAAPGVDDAKVPTDLLEKLSAALLNRTGHDFSGYKPRTFLRRARRRMQVLHLAGIDDYVARLRDDADEASKLFRSLLIGVTSFFRDAAAFEALEKTVIPRLLDGKGTGGTVRVWVPGCATGEEAYSIAILLRERMDELRIEPKVQIFATDIDEAAATIARAGRYQPSVLGNVSPARLTRFFNAGDDGYTLGKGIRDMCVFSTHNVLHHAPFSRLDLISCRNLLIYFGPEFQARVLPVFHFALNPLGILFLGTSENVSQHADLFVPLDKKNRIFQRRDQPTTLMQIARRTPLGQVGHDAVSRFSERAPASLRSQVESRVLERFAPAHVVVNREGDVIYYSSRTGKYLEAAAGPPNRQLLAMARKGLRVDLRAALREALQTMKTVTRERLSFELEGRPQLVKLLVEPFGGAEDDPLFLLLFQDVDADPVAAAERPTEANDVVLERLEQELREGRGRLQTTVEDYETAVEELKSSNEELQSINEELQSTNEELETSKEELQSVNEELNTVNAELNARFDDLDRATADLRNVYDSTRLAIVFLDRDLVVRSFTPAATEIFNLIPGDTGRPLTDIVSNLSDGGDLRRDIHAVYERGEAIERRVHHGDGRRCFLMRVVPYRGDRSAIEGALVTFIDVTTLVDSESRQRALLEELNARAKSILDIVADLTTETLTADPPPKRFAEVFVGRIHALARGYELLAASNWGEVALSEILAAELEGLRTPRKGQFSIKGPPVFFPPPQTLALVMAVHELARHGEARGTLSGPNAHLSVTWEVTSRNPRVLKIEWRETGGKKSPGQAKKGKAPKFPRKLIERELEAALHATVAFAYASAGTRTLITIPFEDLAPEAPP